MQEVTDHNVIAMKMNFPCRSAQRSLKKKPVKSTSEEVTLSRTIFANIQKRSLQLKHKNNPRVAQDRTEHTVRTAKNKPLEATYHQYQLIFKVTKEQDNPCKHNTTRPIGKYLSAPEIEWKKK